MNPDVERLIGRAVSDKAFRDALINDPKDTIRSSGLTLTEDEITKVVDAVARVKKDNKDEAIEAAAAGYWF
ncbi:MAG: Franean1_4349 family RiPP [Herpetosiphonaceae bacterium]|nr:Franean1_4349 family RiPP [Herpetosiphonaceae bacterium]